LTRQKLILGSYTFAKTLEYKAKQGLKSGKEVTVVPPAEYRDRFVNVLEGYFIACPGQLLFVPVSGWVVQAHTHNVLSDKWSKPLDEANLISDSNLLPSVL
jgi:1-phosphatidylinositol-3-phosphate 5-kinase